MGSPYLFQPVGSGGGSGSGAAGINYLSAIYNGDTLTNINTYNDGASATPTNGTGGVVTGLSTTLNTSTPLVGTSCVRFSKDASNRQGEGWSYDFTVDDISSDQSNPLYFQMYYRTSAAYASSDMRIFLYDVTNGTLLNVQDISNGSGNIIAAPADAQISCVGYTVTAATSYRLIWHIASTNASAYDIDLDCFVASPQTTQPGAIVTEWESWTPTGTWIANTTYTGKRRRVGDTLEMDIRVATSGAPTSASLAINMPSGLVIDTSKMTTVAVGLYGFESAGLIGDGGSRSSAVLALYNDTTSFFLGYDNGTGGIGGITQAAPITFANTDFVQALVKIPITGWAASAALSTTETMFSSSSWSGYHDNDSLFARTNTAFGAFSADASSTFTERFNKNMGTVTSKLSGADKLPGIVFTPGASGTYMVTATASVQCTGALSTNYGLRLTNNGGTEIGTAFAQTQNATSNVTTMTVRGFVSASAGSAYTVTMEGFSSASTLNLVSASPCRTIEWMLQRVPDFSIFSVFGTTEYLESSLEATTNWPITASQWGDLTSLSLTPGEWEIVGMVNILNNGAVSAGNLALSTSTTSGNSNVGTVYGLNKFSVYNSGTTTAQYTAVVPRYKVVVTSTTTYYLKAIYGATITNLQYLGYSLTARRIK